MRAQPHRGPRTGRAGWTPRCGHCNHLLPKFLGCAFANCDSHLSTACVRTDKKGRRINGLQNWCKVTMSYLVLWHRHNSRVHWEQSLRNLYTVLLESSKDLRGCARAIGIAKQLEHLAAHRWNLCYLQSYPHRRRTRAGLHCILTHHLHDALYGYSSTCHHYVLKEWICSPRVDHVLQWN